MNKLPSPAETKISILTSAAIIIIVIFALIFATNSRPAYEMCVSSMSLLYIGALLAFTPKSIILVFKEWAVRLYLIYVSIALVLTLTFSDQAYGETIQNGLVLFGYGVIYILSSSLERSNKDHIWWAGLILITFLALYGLVAHRYPNLYLSEKIFNETAVTATFINPNHFATLLGFGMVVAIVQSITSPKTWKIAVPALLICTYTLLQTGSRAGFVSALLGTASVIIIYWNHAPKEKIRRLNPPFLALIIIIPVTALIFFQPSLTLFRFLNLYEAAPIRMSLYTDVTMAIFEMPFFGYGLGSFEALFRVHQTDALDINLTWLNAHSTPLETMFETGVFLLVVPSAALLIKANNLLRLSSASKENLASLGVLVIACTHGLFDNSSSIPAVAVVSACLLGLSFQKNSDPL